MDRKTFLLKKEIDLFQKELSSKDGIIADFMHKIKQITQ